MMYWALGLLKSFLYLKVTEPVMTKMWYEREIKAFWDQLYTLLNPLLIITSVYPKMMFYQWIFVLFVDRFDTQTARVCDVQLFLLPCSGSLCHLISGPVQTPPVGTKWHLVCRDAKDELDIMSRPGLPPMAQHCAPLGLVSSGRECSETERTGLILPAGQIMRNSGISSGSLSHLHSPRIECEELHCRMGTTHLQNNPSFVPLPLSDKTIGFRKKIQSNYFMSFKATNF